MRRRPDPWLVLSLLLLATFAVLGIWNGIRDLRGIETGLQSFTTVCQIAYGVFALLAIPALLTGWRGLRTIMYCWLAAVSLTGGLAPVAWGDTGVGAGIAAMILSGAIALGVIWIVRRAQVAP